MTTVSIDHDAFRIDGEPTYAGRTWQDHKIEGLLMNSRMVQATFDDLNPATRPKWTFPDGEPWDPDRNTDAFVAMIPEWRKAGLLAVTLNFQGGSPKGYSSLDEQVWENSAFAPNGELRPAWLDRMEKCIHALDTNGMVAILGYFYFGQDNRLDNEAAVLRATDNATDWLLSRGYENLIIETANEANVRYHHDLILPPRNHELVLRIKERSGGRWPVGVSMGGGLLHPANLLEHEDVVFLHGNGQKDPNRIREMVRQTRDDPAYRGQPIVFNEDDHFGFDLPDNNCVAAVGSYASWGLFDWRMEGEGYEAGYQSVPTDWTSSHSRKAGFFRLLEDITGGL
ncbi:MAG: hypothetical protein ACFE0O_15010 [Opitutales bacterium]